MSICTPRHTTGIAKHQPRTSDGIKHKVSKSHRVEG